MAGSILAGAAYPAGDAAAEQLLVPVTLWSSVQTGLEASIQVSLREETNFGDLAADAVGYAVASTAVWQQTQELQDLPLVALVDGESLKANVPAGTTLTADNLGVYLENSDLALVVVTPQKLHEILNLALAGAQDPTGENFGSFVQVSGLRFTYRQQDGNYQLESMWLPGLEGEQPLALDDAEGQLALALPADLLVQYGLNADAGYQNYLAVPDGSDPAQPEEGNGADSAPQDAAGQTDGGADTGNGSPAAEAPADAEQQPPVMETPLTLHDALLGLPNNCDAETLAVLLARQGTMGRILPVDASAYTAQLPTTGTAAAGTATVYVDGRPVTGTLDETGLLTIEGLAPGGHTVSLTQDGETRYVSSITHLGTAQGTPLPALEQPEGWEVTPHRHAHPHRVCHPDARAGLQPDGDGAGRAGRHPDADPHPHAPPRCRPPRRRPPRRLPAPLRRCVTRWRAPSSERRRRPPCRRRRRPALRRNPPSRRRRNSRPRRRNRPPACCRCTSASACWPSARSRWPWCWSAAAWRRAASAAATTAAGKPASAPRRHSAEPCASKTKQMQKIPPAAAAAGGILLSMRILLGRPRAPQRVVANCTPMPTAASTSMTASCTSPAGMATPISSRLDRMLLAPENPVARIITGRTNFSAKKPTATNTASRITMRSQLFQGGRTPAGRRQTARRRAPQNTKMAGRRTARSRNSATSNRRPPRPMIAAVGLVQKSGLQCRSPAKNPSSAPVSIMPRPCAPR